MSFNEEKLSLVEGYLPTQANFFYIFLQNAANRLHAKDKLARLEG